MFQTEEFTSLIDDQRTTMKWKFLLERCKVYVKVLCLCVKRVSIASKSYVQILLYCHIDTAFHEGEVWCQRDCSELLIGWPSGGETAHVFPAAALNASRVDWANKKTKGFAISCLMGLVILLWRKMWLVKNYNSFDFLIYVIYLVHYRNFRMYCKINSFILIFNCSINCYFKLVLWDYTSKLKILIK